MEDQDPKVLVWFNSIEATESTRKAYTVFINLYCNCVQKTPSELIEEAIKEIKAGKMPAERKEVEYFAKFKECMKSKGYADKSFNTSLATIRSFYKTFDITLPNSATRVKKANPKRENQNFIQKSDIQNLLTNAKNLREKAIILCMATSGMAMQEIVNLHVGDIEIDSENIGTIAIRRQKEGIDYTTFISPEAVTALQSYWEERNRDPSTAIKDKDNDYAFISYIKGEQISKVVLCNNFRFLGEELGYKNNTTGKDKRKGHIKTRSHTLRKYFASTLEDNGFPKPKIDFMMGHTVSDVDKAYFNRDPSKLKELYKTFLPFLTFEKEINVYTVDAQKFSALEEENKDLQEKVKNLESMMSRLLSSVATMEIGKEITKDLKKK